MDRFPTIRACAIALISCLLPAISAAESPGVSGTEILFGQTAATEGPARALGRGMRRGIAAAFAEVNDAGGVHGRMLRLITLNDSYEPELAIENARHLIAQDKVFALIGSVGTPTSRATEPIASEDGVPFVAPFTGAEFLRQPYRSTVINLRASYFQETEEIVARLTEDLDVRRISVLYQDDSYGRAGLAGVRRALDKRQMPLASEGTYVRNTIAVKTALLTILAGGPEAIIIVGAYQPSAVFTKWARKLGFDGKIVNISFVGSEALAAALGPSGEGVVITQVVPFPAASSLPLAGAYRRALHAYEADATSGFVSFEGYIAGRLTIAALDRIGPDVTREAFLAAFASNEPYDIGGLEFRFGESDNQGLDEVFLTEIQKDGRIAPAVRLLRP